MTPETSNPSSAATQHMAPEPFIGKHEVARRLNKNLRTVDNWMARRVLPYYKIGRSVSFKWSEIETALAQNFRIARS
jgi:excisionase family DNA binding protein